jgi:Fic family protein
MHPREFTSEAAGRCLPTMGGYHAFSPNPLPPELEIDWELAGLLSAADQALAELSGAGQLLPNPHLLIRPYLRREAVLSSLIENTIAGVDELFYLEAGEDNSRNPDLQEVANHVHALEQGLAGLSDWPISTRLLCDLHAILLSDVRGGGSSKTPGEFRRTQNWIGKPGAMLAQATFVPPHPDEMQQALSAWETYLHDQSREPTLVK